MMHTVKKTREDNKKNQKNHAQKTKAYSQSNGQSSSKTAKRTSTSNSTATRDTAKRSKKLNNDNDCPIRRPSHKWGQCHQNQYRDNFCP